MISSRGGPAYTFGDDPRITRIGLLVAPLQVRRIAPTLECLARRHESCGAAPCDPRIDRGVQTRLRPSCSRCVPASPIPPPLKYCRESEFLALIPDPLHYFKTVVTPDKLRLSQDYLERATPSPVTWWSMAGTALALVALLCQSWLGHLGLRWPPQSFSHSLFRKQSEEGSRNPRLTKRSLSGRQTCFKPAVYVCPLSLIEANTALL